MTHPVSIVSRAHAIQTGYPATRITTGVYLSPQLRGLCEDLAVDCGLSDRFVRKALDNDLISIYLTALKDGTAAQRVARKVAMRLDDTLLGTPEPTYTLPPYDPPEPWKPPEPRKPTPEPTPPMDVAALRALIKQEVREGVLGPVQRTLDGLADEMEKLPDVAAETALARVQSEIERAAMKAAVAALKSLTPARLDVTINQDPAPVSLGLVHRETAKIINALACGVNVYLHGPAGSGKTTVARKCAEAFKLQFYFMAKVESEYLFLGFKDAKGETVRTQFREAYEHGGVFLLDEMDACSPGAIVALNAALANGVCSFPDGIVPRHKDFRCIGAGNTKLTGATRAYAGRNQQDAASIDRFSFIEFGYDDELELALATDHEWAKYVQRARAVVAERGLNHLITPRATYDGCKLLAGGFDRDTVADMVVFKGLDPDTVKQIQRAM